MTIIMADHQELVAEMLLLDKMTTQERLKLARKRRIQQLKKWSQKDKEFVNQQNKIRGKSSSAASKGRKGKVAYKVHFVPSVMLLESAARNDVDEVRRLLMLGVSPDSTNEDGLTALHQCCIDDSEDMMKLLIEFGANVNARDTEMWTPLHAAATCGHLHLVKYLIDKEADLLAVNADGNMPYDICEDEGTLDYIESEMAKRGITQDMIDETRAVTENRMLSDLKAIKEASGDLEFRDSATGATPLHVAAANGYLSVVEFLLENHVSTDVVDSDLWQPIHAAACWGHPDVLEALVQAGADLEVKTKNGETPLDICEDPEIRERIIQLKSESELTSTSHRLRRSHSSNTRSQSVRRTSIREKSQLSRREAREEGNRLRVESTGSSDIKDDPLDNQRNGQNSMDDELRESIEEKKKIRVHQSKSSTTRTTSSSSTAKPNVQSSSSSSSTPMTSSHPSSSSAIKNIYTNDHKVNGDINPSPTESDHPVNGTSTTSGPSTGSPRESLKVEVYVTVNTNSSIPSSSIPPPPTTNHPFHLSTQTPYLPPSAITPNCPPSNLLMNVPPVNVTSSPSSCTSSFHQPNNVSLYYVHHPLTSGVTLSDLKRLRSDQRRSSSGPDLNNRTSTSSFNPISGSSMLLTDQIQNPISSIRGKIPPSVAVTSSNKNNINNNQIEVVSPTTTLSVDPKTPSRGQASSNMSPSSTLKKYRQAEPSSSQDDQSSSDLNKRRLGCCVIS